MSKFLLPYISLVISLVVLDYLWLVQLMSSYFKKAYGSLLATQMNNWAIVLFYLLYPIGLIVFVYLPNSSSSLFKLFLMGAFFGLIAYATYDLTGLALIKNWPKIASLVDVLWGAFISGAVVVITRLVVNLFVR